MRQNKLGSDDSLQKDNIKYSNIENDEEKNDYVNSLDDMFSEDERKRLGAAKTIREIAAVIGPSEFEINQQASLM